MPNIKSLLQNPFFRESKRNRMEHEYESEREPRSILQVPLKYGVMPLREWNTFSWLSTRAVRNNSRRRQSAIPFLNKRPCVLEPRVAPSDDGPRQCKRSRTCVPELSYIAPSGYTRWSVIVS